VSHKKHATNYRRTHCADCPPAMPALPRPFPKFKPLGQTFRPRFQSAGLLDRTFRPHFHRSTPSCDTCTTPLHRCNTPRATPSDPVSIVQLPRNDFPTSLTRNNTPRCELHAPSAQRDHRRAETPRTVEPRTSPVAIVLLRIGGRGTTSLGKTSCPESLNSWQSTPQGSDHRREILMESPYASRCCVTSRIK